MKCVQIYTERKNINALIGLAGGMFSSFTLVRGLGVYKGKEEGSLIFTVIGADPLAVKDFANVVKVLNNQQCVLVVESEVNAEFI